MKVKHLRHSLTDHKTEKMFAFIYYMLMYIIVIYYINTGLSLSVFMWTGIEQFCETRRNDWDVWTWYIYILRRRPLYDVHYIIPRYVLFVRHILEIHCIICMLIYCCLDGE